MDLQVGKVAHGIRHGREPEQRDPVRDERPGEQPGAVDVPHELAEEDGTQDCSRSGGSEDHVGVLGGNPDDLADVRGRERVEHEEDEDRDAHLSEREAQSARSAQRVEPLLEVEDHHSEAASALLDGRLGMAFKLRNLGGEDQARRDEEQHDRAPVGIVEVEPGDDGREDPTHHQGQHHREQRHRIRGDKHRARQNRRDDRCFRRPEQLAHRGKDECDQEQVEEVILDAWDHRCDGDRRDHRRAADVAPQHDLFAVDAVRDHARNRGQQHGGHRVREKGHRDRRAAVRDVVREDDQREKKELVGQLCRKLSEPYVAKRGVLEHAAKAARSLDGQPDRIHSR